MPEMSSRIRTLKPSATLALNTRSRQLRAEGKKVWNFSVGEPDYPCPQEVVDAAIHQLSFRPVRYGSAGGGPSLRQAVQQKMRIENDVICSQDEVVCGVGAKQILYHLMHVILNPGEKLLVHVPCWTSYGEQVKSVGASLATIPYLCDNSKDSQDHDPFDPDYIERFVDAQVKAFLLCSPNNPMGYVVSEAALTRLAHYLLKKDWWIISDEIYEYLTFQVPHKSLLTVCPKLRDRFIYINGVSKSYAMTGWRMGYCVAPRQVAAGVKTLISHSSTCLPGFIETAAEVAITHGPSSMRSSIATLEEKKTRALSIIDTIPHMSYSPVQGAFYIFCDIRAILQASSFTEAEGSLALCSDLLETVQVSVVAGEAFLAPGFIRISYAVSLEDLEEGLQRLREYIVRKTS